MARDNVHISFGQGQHGGWGFGISVRTYRGDYAWKASSAGTAEVAPRPTPTRRSSSPASCSPRSGRPPVFDMGFHDFWTTVYQAIDD